MKIPVHFTPGDGSGWAIDEDLRQIRLALKGDITETTVARAKIVYSPFWAGLAFYPIELLQRRFVICHADNPPFFYLRQGAFGKYQNLVDLWIARSMEAFEQFKTLQLPVRYVPYATDANLFNPLDLTDDERAARRKQYNIPEDAYVISNFHRDTEADSHGNFTIPKAQKNPELLIEIAEHLRTRNLNFHILLAGPRRHWLRNELSKRNLPFTFIGEEIEGDDFGKNILNRKQLNELYALSDLYLVPSRWEGGPQSIMEAAAARCAILSTRVGLAMDILNPNCLFGTPREAADLIEKDIHQWSLRGYIREHSANFHGKHNLSCMTEKLPSILSESYEEAKKKAHLLIASDRLQDFTFKVKRRIPIIRFTSRFHIKHTYGISLSLDNYVNRVKRVLKKSKLLTEKNTGILLIGLLSENFTDLQTESFKKIAFLGVGDSDIQKNTNTQNTYPVVVPSVADAVERRKRGDLAPLVCQPFLDEEFVKTSQEELKEAHFSKENEETNLAAERIWKSLSASLPISYLRGSALREQVFNAGPSFENPADTAQAETQLEAEADSFRRLIWFPSAAHSLKQFRELFS
ncbi:MAG: glycosyltransferase family 4 protein [Chthoniobacterales bacterium]